MRMFCNLGFWILISALKESNFFNTHKDSMETGSGGGDKVFRLFFKTEKNIK